MDISPLEEFFRKNSFTLVKRIKARGMQEADAEDVVQEAFYRALKYFQTYDSNLMSVDAWFSSILNNSFKDYRHANFTGDYSFTEEHLEDTYEGEDRCLDKKMIELIREKVTSLDTSQRNIIELVLLNGFTTREASQILGLNREAVKKTVTRFKSKLKERYGE